MVAVNLFEKIGYTEEMISEYQKYASIIDGRFETLAKETVLSGNYWFDACKKAREIVPQINEYTSDLMFMLECTGYLLQKYKENNLSDQMFYDAMQDISCKTRECLKFKNVFGTFVAEWQSDFFNLKRFAFGRLQFDVSTNWDEAFKVGDHIIENRELVLCCHIPSMGPLLHEQCLESYKMAYNHFKNELNGGILVVRCDSWLLMPDYMEIFKNSSPNIFRFAQDFEIITVSYSETFGAAWRVFNAEATDDNIDLLPQNTKLQKGFVEHIKNGSGIGILLFDGCNVLR